MCCALLSCSVLSDSLQPHGLKPTRLLCPWGFPGRNTGMGCHALLQGIVPTQGLSSALPHCRWILYHLNQQGSPRILAWATYPFSRGTSSARNWTGVSWVAMVKSLLAMWETWVRSMGWKDPLKKRMATHSSILAWKIPWIEEPGGLQSEGCRELDMVKVT